MISDDNFFFEVKKDYAKDMVTGFIRLNGNTIGAIANRTALYDEEGKEAETFDGTLSAEGAEKAAEFVNFSAPSALKVPSKVLRVLRRQQSS